MPGRGKLSGRAKDKVQPKVPQFGAYKRLIQIQHQEHRCASCNRLFGKDQMIVDYKDEYFCNWTCSCKKA